MFSQVTDGQWKGVTAGGCRNHPTTYPFNPRYRIMLDSTDQSNELALDLKGPKQYQMGIEVTIVSLVDESVTAPFKTKSSGAFRQVVFGVFAFKMIKKSTSNEVIDCGWI